MDGLLHLKIIGNSADGYMTAWFMCWLKDDAEAEKAFFGENAELFANPNWQDAAANAPIPVKTWEFPKNKKSVPAAGWNTLFTVWDHSV